MRLARRLAASLVLLRLLGPLAGLAAAPAAAQSALDTLARGETVALAGDPPAMRLDDCATQRNLDDAGRAQARAIGARLRRAGIATARIQSSRWCRCHETATLLGLGPVEPQPALDSFFATRDQATARTAVLSALLAALGDDAPAILVTHQVNITALTGIVPAPAEVVLVDRRPPHAVRARLP